MATIVASRFAVLSVDDDDDDDDNLYPSKKKKVQNKKSLVKCSNQVAAKPDLQQRKKKKSENLISNKNKSTSSTHVSKNVNETSPEWDEWKQEGQLSEDNFEEQLSKAIFLSKLEYEKSINSDDSVNKRNNKKENKKKKSHKAASVHDLEESVIKTNFDKSEVKCTKTDNKKKEKIEPSTSHNISSKDNSSTNKKLDTDFSQESLTLVRYQASMDEKDREIEQLKAEIENLNTQLKNVKSRNTKLCQIIASSEMKDKAEVLMEVERLQAIKDELSTEVSNLHILLEQERSKVRQLTGEHKNKNKKHQIQ